MSIDELRAQLMAEGLPAEIEGADPIATFEEWLATAREQGFFNANAMAVATVSGDGVPSVRNVLMQGVIDGAFTFYTNYGSRKGTDLTKQPLAEALFSWLTLERQIRVSGAGVSPQSRTVRRIFRQSTS